MLDFIPSQYYQNYCKKNGITFTDRQIAVIIWDNPTMTLEKKLSALKKIASETDDNELIIEIKAWTEYKSKSLEMLRNPLKGEEFYLISPYSYGEGAKMQIFDSLEKAREWMSAFFGNTNYTVAKLRLYDDNCATIIPKYNCAADVDKSGEIMNAWNYKPFDAHRLEYGFIPFANPFERGDVVRDCRNGKIGVVETSREEWKDYLKRSENNKAYDFSDAGLIVQFLNDEGFMHEHIPPIYLEKVPLKNNGIPKCLDTKNNINDDLLLCASELMRGTIALDVFTSIFLEWRESKIYKQIKSQSWRRKE